MMTKIKPEYLRCPLDSKEMWKESAYVAGDRQILANIGRQQQAGKVELMNALESFLAKIQPEESFCEFVVFESACDAFRGNRPFSEGLDFTLEPSKYAHVFVYARILEHLNFGLEWTWSTTPLQLEYGFLERAKRLEETGNIDTALDLIYDQVNWKLKTQRFQETDQLLQNINVADYSIDLLLAVLTATLPARSRLPLRAKFFSEVEEVLKERGQWEDNLLVGLEN